MDTPRDTLGLTQEIKSVQIVNSSDTQFILGVTDSRFGFGLSAQYYYATVPDHVWSGQDFTSPNFGQDVVSGPFYHLAYGGGNTLILKANPYYWNGPGISEIDVTFVSNSTAAAGMLMNGETDIVQVSPNDSSVLVRNSSLGIKTEPDRGIVYMEYNVSSAPFNSAPFRQALADGINTSMITQNVFGGYATPGALARGLIPPSASSWYNQSSSEFPFNATEAKNLLSGLGYSWNGSNFLLYPNGTAVNFKIYTDTNTSSDVAVTQIVAAELRSIGFQISVVVIPLPEIIQNYSFNFGDIRSQLVILSSYALPFGDGYLDILPASSLYFPWFNRPSAFLYPPSAQSQYEQLASVTNSTTNPTLFQSSVKDIDGLEAQYLPVLVLAYPDTYLGVQNRRHQRLSLEFFRF